MLCPSFIGITAGVDMIMVPLNHTEFINTLTDLVKKKYIPMSRINDAVRRILRVTFIMGLFENPLSDDTFIDELGSQAHRDLAREAVRKSLVIFKNDGPMIPLSKNASRILVAGTHANNLGYQCGGWSIAWQGLSGNNNTAGTIVLSAITSAVDLHLEVVFNENLVVDFVKSNTFDYAIVVVGETPYAETAGDSMNLTIPEPGPSTINNVCGAIKCVVIVISDRPIVVEPYLSKMNALVVAWLPGNE